MYLLFNSFSKGLIKFYLPYNDLFHSIDSIDVFNLVSMIQTSIIYLLKTSLNTSSQHINLPSAL